jgi:opacity protein-like surface antigen
MFEMTGGKDRTEKTLAKSTPAINSQFKAHIRPPDQILSSDDIEFYAQISFGLAYHVTDNWDLYGGMRWTRLSDMDFGTSIPIELVDDQFAWEIGARYNF